MNEARSEKEQLNYAPWTLILTPDEATRDEAFFLGEINRCANRPEKEPTHAARAHRESTHPPARRRRTVSPSTTRAACWLLLVGISLPVSWLLRQQGVPAAFLVGSMACAIALSLSGVRLALPRRFFFGAQALIGCAVAETITAAIVLAIIKDWAVMLLIVGSTVLAGALVGWTLVRWRALPGTTAAWGSIPGGASAMVAMADAYGADARLVALMQYLRVLIVVLTASMVASLLVVVVPTAGVAAAPSLFEFGPWPQVIITLALAAVGAFLGALLHIPAGAILVPIVLGGALRASEVLVFHQPFWMQAGASALIGWYVGLGFDRDILRSALRLLPRILLSIVFLIGLCSVSAALLVFVVHTDPLTAYLATSPGGLDSMVLIAMGSGADVPFVVAVQTLRLFVVILVGPSVAQLICRYAPDSAQR